ncbi:MAG: hypothetical protein WC422_03605 [Candidatus Paceibacterota bacterium]
MKIRFKVVNGSVFDTVRGKPMTDEELFLMLGEPTLGVENYLNVLSYLMKHGFRDEVSISDEIIVKQNVVNFIPGNGIPPFALTTQQLLAEAKWNASNPNWNQPAMIMHPDGFSVISLTPSQLAQIKIVADTIHELY